LKRIAGVWGGGGSPLPLAASVCLTKVLWVSCSQENLISIVPLRYPVLVVAHDPRNGNCLFCN
jgi:hypothetical protein